MQHDNGAVVHSVDKALSLLELLLQRRQPMSLQELSEASGFPKSTAHALLATLRRHSMIAQREDGRYYLGTRLLEYGFAVSSAWNISQIAHPYLMQLSAKTNASTFISLLGEDGVTTFDQFVGALGPQVVPEVGQRISLHATSQGKLLLSTLSDEEVLRRLNRTGLQTFTPHTITDPAVLLCALADIRKQGYAVEDGEYKIGLRSVSAPVRDHSGRVCYALGIVGLFRRVRSPEFQEAITQVVAQAEKLSEALGCRKELR